VHLGKQRSHRAEARSAPRPKMSVRPRRARDRVGGPCRSELKTIGLARLIIGPLGTFLGVEGG
jgi:hypothetical protein